MSDSESEYEGEIHPFIEENQDKFEALYDLTESIKDLQKQLLAAKREKLQIEREICDLISELPQEEQIELDVMVYKNLKVIYSTKTALNVEIKKSKKSKK